MNDVESIEVAILPLLASEVLYNQRSAIQNVPEHGAKFPY